MTTHLNPDHAREVVRTLIESTMAGEWHRVSESALPDAIMHISEQAYLKGVESVAPYIDHYRAYYKIEAISIDTLVEGDRAAAQAMMRITYENDKPGFPPARGQSKDLPIVLFFRFEGDKVAAARLVYSLDEWLSVFNEVT